MKKNIYNLVKYQIFILLLLVVPFMSIFANTITTTPRGGQITTVDSFPDFEPNYNYSYVDMYGVERNGTTHYFQLQTSDSKNLYCIQPGVDFSNSQPIEYTLNGIYTGGNLVCQLIKYEKSWAESNKKTLGTERLNWNNLTVLDYVKVQKAIWDSLGQASLTGPCSNNTSPTYKVTKQLSSGSLSISIVDEKTTLNKNNTYYISNKINVSKENLIDGKYNIVITGAEGAYAVETIGGTPITQTSSDSFYIVLPLERVTQSNIKVEVKGNYLAETINTYGLNVKRYVSGDADQHQDVVMIENTSSSSNTQKSVTDDLTLSVELSKLTITKIDSETEEPIANVKFKLFDEEGNIAKYANGQEVGILTTNEKGQIIVQNLLRGNYKLKEIEVPEGYILNSSEQLIIISSANEEKTIKNTPISTLTIIKKDLKTEKTIEGVSFALLDKDGNIAKKGDGTEIGVLKTNSEGKIIVEGLLYGDYYLKELTVPEGYILNSNELPIKINSKKAETTVTNVPVDITKISKIDSVTGKALTGAELRILDSNGEELISFTSTEEVFEIYLSPGLHYIEEVTAPEGYDKLNSRFEFEVTQDGNIVAISESDSHELKDGIIYVYNTPTPEEVVEVPDTGSNMNLYFIVGGLLFTLGSIITISLYRRKKIVDQI